MTRQTLLRYATALGLTVCIAALSWMSGDPPEAVLHKALAAPLLLLAFAGLRSHFPSHLDATRGTAATIEYHLLGGGILATFVLFTGSFDDVPVLIQIRSFVLMMLVCGGLNAVIALYHRRRPSA